MWFAFFRRQSRDWRPRRQQTHEKLGIEDFRETFAAEVAAMEELAARPDDSRPKSAALLLMRPLSAVRSRTTSRSRKNS